MNKTIHRSALATAILLGTTAAWADSFEGQSKDAWLTGKIETVFLLNRHLNPFRIDTDVENGVATLSGTVESDVDRDLAIELAEGVEGVVDVENNLLVDVDNARPAEPEAADGASRSFGTWVDDATTTAAVKSRLIGNEHIKGLQIDVDTLGDVVTLSGRVDSSEQKDLAGEIARNTDDVRDVRNNLVVDPQ